MNLGQTVLHGSSSYAYSGRQPLRVNGTGFLWAGCPSCHPAIGVKALKGTQSSNRNLWPGFILCSWIHNQTPVGRGIALLWLTTPVLYLSKLSENSSIPNRLLGGGKNKLVGAFVLLVCDFLTLLLHDISTLMFLPLEISRRRKFIDWFPSFGHQKIVRPNDNFSSLPSWL